MLDVVVNVLVLVWVDSLEDEDKVVGVVDVVEIENVVDVEDVEVVLKALKAISTECGLEGDKKNA